jgi:hypothetical protein
MAVLVAEPIERPPALFADDERPERDGRLGGRPALDEAIVDAWEGLVAQLAVACPVCRGAMRPRPAAGEVAGRCEDCGASLS